MKKQYLIGQRVIVANQFIGTVHDKQESSCRADRRVWVCRPNGIESCYDEDNVQELPNGQL